MFGGSLSCAAFWGRRHTLAERRQEATALTGCKAFAALDELLAGSSSEVIVIATPSSSHFRDASRVLESDRHCLLEKPMAMNTAEARQLQALAQRKGLKLFVHHNLLHGAEYRHLHDVVTSGVLGPIFNVRAFWASYSRRWDWQALKRNGGGTLNNTCPHVLTILLPLLGSRVNRVSAELKNVKDPGDAEDHVELFLQTDQGVSASVVVSTALALGAPRWMLCGRNGTLTSDGTKSRLRYFDAAAAPQLSVLDEAAPGRAYQKETLPWIEQEIEVASSAVSSFHDNVYAVLALGAAQVVTPESAVEVIRVLELSRLAAERPAPSGD